MAKPIVFLVGAALSGLLLCGCHQEAALSVPASVPAATPKGPPIFDLLSLMGKSPKQVKHLLRFCYLSDQYRMQPGDPYPGELEMVFLHAKGKFPEMDIAFDSQDRCHWLMYHELEPLGYSFDQYTPLLSRLGMPVDQLPDGDYPSRRAWSNWQGHSISVFRSGIGDDQNLINQVEVGRPEDHV